jgi:peptide deformylase
MALRNVRKYGDSVLRKVCKPITDFNDSLRELANDMVDTMYEFDGVGLAGPQVGIPKRIIVIDVGEGINYLINPEMIHEEGEEVKVEGCLSLPGVYGEVKRPTKVTVKAQNLAGHPIKVEGEGLMARALCHEIDHLNGILFVDKVIKFVEE